MILICKGKKPVPLCAACKRLDHGAAVPLKGAHICRECLAQCEANRKRMEAELKRDLKRRAM